MHISKLTFNPVLLYLAVLWFLPIVPVGADEIGQGEKVIHGEKGAWQSFWHGLGNAQRDASDLPRSCAAIVKVLDAAKDADFPSFCSFFLLVDTNHPPEQIKTWYDEWKIGTQQYIYLIGQEALLDESQSSRSNLYAAVSIVPCALKNPEQTVGALSQLKAQVIFAEKTSDGWKLLSDVLDRKLQQVMLERASFFAYKPRDFSKEAVDRDIRKFHEDVVEEKRKKGASPVEIASLKERFQVQEKGAGITSWADWTNYYHAVVLDPPVVFDVRDEVSMDFSNPVSACRSYMRASFLSDLQTLHKNADPTETARLKKRFSMNTGDTNAVRTLDMSPKLALITVLLTATTSVDGKNYTMVLWRSQNAQNPTNDLIGFQSTFFVDNPESKSYLATQDLRDSTFASVLAVAGAPSAGLGKYVDIYNKMKKSAFPTNFYLIH